MGAICLIGLLEQFASVSGHFLALHADTKIFLGLVF
jgi:hypothetical protein